MKLKRWYIFLTALLPLFVQAQHGRSYTQYMFNGLLFNPAYAGSHEALNFTTLYRNQWSGIEGAPKVLSFTAHAPLKNRKLNLGVSLEHEKIGLYDRTNLNSMYAYRLPLRKGSLSLGLQAGVNIQSFNRNGLRIHDQDDPSLLLAATGKTNFQAGAGLFYRNEKFYFGIAAPDMFMPEKGIKNAVQLHTGSLIDLGDDLKIKPSVLLRYIENSPLFVNLAGTFYFKEIIGAGVGYTYKSGWFVMLDCQVNEQINFGYAFERSTGSIATYSWGTHEIMIRYLFRYSLPAINPRYF